ncbi:ATP-binding protein [Halorubrum ruber]|uniref:ATP-binding protein n=1 Tax=Halorubrum ruber TaxID=2982524 RepID=UPI0020137A95|nr:ATP-binding protein [Halorubrum ruber]
MSLPFGDQLFRPTQVNVPPNSDYDRNNIIVYIIIDRETEIERLTSHLSREERQLLVVYGRRRVGKTTLVTTALEELDIESVYALFSRSGFTDELRTTAADRSDSSLYGLDELTDLFERTQ